MEELLSLKWNNHRSTFLHILSVLRDKQLYTDATLACEGRFYSVHRLVLSTCSDYFSAMFDRTICKNPIIVLKDIKCEDLEALLDYMYLGEVNVRQADLASLIKAAECLRVKGLAVPDDEPPRKGRSDSSKIRNDSGHSPPSKRKRRDVIDEVKEDIKPSSAIPKTHIQSRLSPLIRDSMGESGQTSPSHLQNTNKSHTNNISEPINNMEETPFVKVEVEDSGGGEDIGESTYNLSNDSFKEESDADPGADMDKDLPEFLEHASGSSFSHSFGTGPSYQPDLQNWQGDQVLSGNYSGLGYGPSQSQDGSQNTSGGVASSGKFASIGSGSPSVSLWNCTVCGRGFNRHWHLKRHLATHLAVKPYSCPYCPHAANIKANLALHIRKMHQEKQFSSLASSFSWYDYNSRDSDRSSLLDPDLLDGQFRLEKPPKE